MKSRSLRRQKLWWCAGHNTTMREFQQMPVKYLLLHMPEFLRLFHGDQQRALDNLNQYLSSDKPAYWKTRQIYVRELCHALCLSTDTWNCGNLADFKIAARAELQAQGFYSEGLGTNRKILLTDELRQLPAVNGNAAISFDVDRSCSALAFRRGARHPISRRFSGADRVRIRFHPPSSGHGLLFLLDPTDHCQILAPTLYQRDTCLRNGELCVPDLHEEKFHTPEKIGCYSLYAITAGAPLSGELANTDGDRRLADDDLRSLIDLCSSLIQDGHFLFRTDFLIAADTDL